MGFAASTRNQKATRYDPNEAGGLLRGGGTMGSPNHVESPM